MTAEDRKAGEVWLDEQTLSEPGDATLRFIGRVQSSWSSTTPTPRNPQAARERGEPAAIEIFPAFRAGLLGLERFSHVIVLAWLDRASRRPLVITPPYADTPRGVFALRSPVRPNPIGLSVCRLLQLDRDAGRLDLDAIDFLDGTPIIDLKPYRPGIDAVPDAIVG